MKKIISIFLFNFFLLNSFPQGIECDNSQIKDAYDLAVNTVQINVRRGILAAGGDYGGEWTRDIAINSWNGVSLIMPGVAEKSLWSVTINKDTIGHQYWDKIIWVIAALNHYNITGDPGFLKQSYRCSDNTMNQLEKNVFDKEYGLFTGPAVLADGIAGYPEPVFDKTNYSSFVLDHKDASTIKCLSTNCLYYGAYISLIEMATTLQKDSEVIDNYKSKASRLKDAILKYFYNEKENKLYYLIDHQGNIDKSQEAMGYSFAVIFGIINKDQAFRLINNTVTSKYGITCVYPDFPRYSPDKPGRHNNILWPMATGFFAQACILGNNMKSFTDELNGLTHLALDEDKGNYQFWEIYNPYTGKPDGGYQAAGKERPDYHWNSCRLQTWSATAYIHMIHFGLAGIRVCNDFLRLEPFLPENIHYLKLTDLLYRQARLSIVLIGNGRKIKTFLLNGIKQTDNIITPDIKGNNEVVIELE